MPRKIRLKHHVSIRLYFIKFFKILFLDRKIVLRHHPDKQKNDDINCHYYFCITKGNEYYL